MGNVFTVDTTRSFVVLTISDSLNCQTSEIFQFYEHVFNPFQNSYSQFCDGDSVTLNAGSAYTSYLWSTGDTTQTITLFNNQAISVTTTDTIGCVGVDSVNINKITLTIPILTYDSLTCTLYLDSMGAGYYVWVNNTGAFAINTPSVVVPGQGSYHVQYSNYGCMANTDTMNINCSPVGFDEINTIQNTIFITNPVRDKIFIYWKNTLPDNLVICLTDATGKEIKRVNATNGTAVINMQAAAKGIYFLKLLNAEKQEFAVKKIVKVD
jgi:hypothetical protein